MCKRMTPCYGITALRRQATNVNDGTALRDSDKKVRCSERKDLF